MQLALDLGSTHWKAAVYPGHGALQVYKCEAPFVRGAQGRAQVSPDGFRQALCGLVREIPEAVRAQIRGISLTGMAEGGVLLARETLAPLTPVVPWYDTRSTGIAERMIPSMDVAERHRVTGLPASYKYSVFRLLDALARTGHAPTDALWAGVVDYAALLLTGARFIDPTLAARSFALRLDTRTYDADWLASLGLPEDAFSPVVPSGVAGGTLLQSVSEAVGLPADIPVCVAGHDHVCAAYGAGIAGPGALYGSLGTAQVLLGVREGASPTADAVQTGLSFGPALEADAHTVLGSIQSAGGSITWAKRLLYGEGDYATLLSEVHALPEGPGGLLYYPYLSGSGAPHLDANARGAFIGLAAQTERAQMMLAVYEGIAMESRLILEEAGLLHTPALVISGGLTAHTRFLAVLADVLGMDIRVSAEPEGTLYGAVRLACTRQGIECPAVETVLAATPTIHSMAYIQCYETAYRPLLTPLRQAFAALQGGKQR